MEQGKSVSLPARGRYIARCFDGGADSIKGKSEGRSVMERISVEFSQGNITERESEPTSHTALHTR
jgi:hypothetical protein